MTTPEACHICAGKKVIYPTGEKEIKEAFVDMRIRIGTLLKTDNVSFLLVWCY